MSEVLSVLAVYISYPFVQYALIVGVLVALCASLLGVSLVLKRFSFIGDGLSHVAFGALAIATILHVNNELIVMIPITVLAAILLLGASNNAMIKGDASIAMISVGALAFGYLVLSKFSGSTNVSADVCSTLFGATSILTLTLTDVWLCIAMSIFVLFIFVFFYNKIFAVTFDETFSEATGIRAKVYNYMIAVITALVIVLAMELVGSLLVSALIIFPALSAMRVFKSFRAVTLCSAVIAVVGTTVGMLCSILASTPVGASIVAVDVVIFALFSLAGLFRK